MTRQRIFLPEHKSFINCLIGMENAKDVQDILQDGDIL